MPPPLPPRTLHHHSHGETLAPNAPVSHNTHPPGDALLAEAQDGSGINNANMATPELDGRPPRMQMFLWYMSPFPSVTLEADNFPAGEAFFGPPITNFSGFSAPLKLMSPAYGCSPTATGSLTGAIVIVDRGNCSFQDKVGCGSRLVCRRCRRTRILPPPLVLCC